MEAIITVTGQPDVPVEMQARFDEFNLDVTVRYRGKPLERARSVPSVEAMADAKSCAAMSMFLAQRYCDRLEIERRGDDNILKLHFVH